jgi:branched-chain amino acid aminotransferase
MYYSDKTKVFLNGSFIKAKNAQSTLFGQSMHYGSGVFEGIRSYKTEEGARVFKAEEHYERLLFSAKKSHIKLDYEVEELVSITNELLRVNKLSDAYIRPLVYLGQNMALSPTSEVNLFICAWNWGRYLGEGGLRLMTSPFERPNPKSCHVEAKVSGHYTNSILATTDAKAKGYDEALLLDQNGFVAEGPGANFFFEKDGKLFTPQRGNILPGITRSTIIDIARDLGYTVVEGQYTLKDLENADGAFFTGTAAEVAGIDSLDDKKFNKDWEDTLGYELSNTYQLAVLGQYNQAYTVI